MTLNSPPSYEDGVLFLLLIEILNKALKLLNNADTIYVYGITNAIAVAYDFKYSMRTISKKVEIVENLDEFPYTVSYTTKKDVSLFISYSGENKELLKFANHLHRTHKPIISITSIGENSLSSFSDVILHMCTREKLYSKINNYTSKTSTFYLLNALFKEIVDSTQKRTIRVRQKGPKRNILAYQWRVYAAKAA